MRTRKWEEKHHFLPFFYALVDSSVIYSYLGCCSRKKQVEDRDHLPYGLQETGGASLHLTTIQRNKTKETRNTSVHATLVSQPA